MRLAARSATGGIGGCDTPRCQPAAAWAGNLAGFRAARTACGLSGTGAAIVTGAGAMETVARRNLSGNRESLTASGGSGGWLIPCSQLAADLRGIQGRRVLLFRAVWAGSGGAAVRFPGQGSMRGNRAGRRLACTACGGTGGWLTPPLGYAGAS